MTRGAQKQKLAIDKDFRLEDDLEDRGEPLDGGRLRDAVDNEQPGLFVVFSLAARWRHLLRLNAGGLVVKQALLEGLVGPVTLRLDPETS